MKCQFCDVQDYEMETLKKHMKESHADGKYLFTQYVTFKFDLNSCLSCSYFYLNVKKCSKLFHFSNGVCNVCYRDIKSTHEALPLPRMSF